MAVPDRTLRAAIVVSLAVHGLILFSLPAEPPVAESARQRLDARLMARPTQVAAAAIPRRAAAADRKPAPVLPAARPVPPAVANDVATGPARKIARGPAGHGDALASITPVASRQTNPVPMMTTTDAPQGNDGQRAAPPGMEVTTAPALASNGGGASDADAVRAYRLAVATKARGFKRYPASALAAGWAGTAEVRINVSPGGKPQDVNLERSSGYDALDRAAIAMIEAGMVRATVPEPLLGRAFAVTLPVVFEPDLR